MIFHILFEVCNSVSQLEIYWKGYEPKRIRILFYLFSVFNIYASTFVAFIIASDKIKYTSVHAAFNSSDHFAPSPCSSVYKSELPTAV